MGKTLLDGILGRTSQRYQNLEPVSQAFQLDRQRHNAMKELIFGPANGYLRVKRTIPLTVPLIVMTDQFLGTIKNQ